MSSVNGHSILEFAPDKDESIRVACEHIRVMRANGDNLPLIVENVRAALKIAGHEVAGPTIITGDEVTYWLAQVWKDYVRLGEAEK